MDRRLAAVAIFAACFIAARAAAESPSANAPPPETAADGGTAVPRSVTRPLSEMPADDPLRAMLGAVGGLADAASPGETFCTVVRVSRDLVLTANLCIRETAAQSLVFVPAVRDGKAAVPARLALPPAEVVRLPSKGSNADGTPLEAALLRIEDPAALPGSWAPLDASPPMPGATVATLSHDGGAEPRFARGGGCTVVGLYADEFSHRCVLDMGSAGAPILDASAARVVGIEWGIGGDGTDLALRADRLLAASETLRAAVKASPRP